MKGNTRKFAISCTVLFLFIWGYEWLVHTQVLNILYIETTDTWRPDWEMQELSHYFLIVYAMYALIFTTLYKRYINAKNLTEGARFGFLVGALIGAWSFGAYVFLPISIGLAACWFLANTVAGTISGALLEFINNRR